MAAAADLAIDFAAPVPDGGYRWWYLDAFSEDFANGISVIAMVGSPFSPWYAWARRRGAAPALNHCAMNVALYGSGLRRWAMTERGAGSVARCGNAIAIGNSAMRWDGTALTVTVDELTAPWPRRLRGRVRLVPEIRSSFALALDNTGRHGWRAIAPRARVEIAMTRPHCTWRGQGYFDTNWGSRPLEEDFSTWQWSRARLVAGAAVTYDVLRRDGSRMEAALRYRADGICENFALPDQHDLGCGFWRLRRLARGTATPRVTRVLEDSPFYARSLVSTTLCDDKVTSVHESLSLTRFDTAWMRLLLPFKAPRALRRMPPVSA